MSKQGVRRLIGEVIGDDAFRTKFFENPEKTTKESGFDLSEAEISAVTKLKPDDLKVGIEEREAGDGAEAGFDIDVRTAKF